MYAAVLMEDPGRCGTPNGFVSQVGLEQKLLEGLSTGYLASHLNTAITARRALEAQSRSLELQSIRGRQRLCGAVVAGNVSLVASARTSQHVQAQSRFDESFNQTRNVFFTRAPSTKGDMKASSNNKQGATASASAVAGAAARTPNVGPVLPSLPEVPSFHEVEREERPHQGLLMLDQANTLLDEGDMDKMKELLVDALEEYVEVARALVEGETDKKSIQEGLPKAIDVYMRAKVALPEALDLVGWFCSAHMICLERLAYDMANHSAGRRVAATTTAASGGGNGERCMTSPANSSFRMLRLLITGFRSFLDNARSKLFCNEYHMKHLERAVGHAREAVKNIADECCGPNPVVGKAAARLKGMTATACFTRLHNAAYDNVQPAGNQLLYTWGYNDVSKLLKCISADGNQGPATAYLQMEGNCIEALSALCSLAMMAPQVYPTIAIAFAEAVQCMDASSSGKWGDRPALQHITVRHTVIACSSHLADRVGKNPDRVRQNAFHQLWAALSDCCIMQTGHYVCDQAPVPNTAGARAIAEEYSGGGKPGSPRASSTIKIGVPRRGEGNVKNDAAKGGGSSAGDTGSSELSWKSVVGPGRKRPHSPRSPVESHSTNRSSWSKSSIDESSTGRSTKERTSSDEKPRSLDEEDNSPQSPLPCSARITTSTADPTHTAPRSITPPPAAKVAPAKPLAAPVTLPSVLPDWKEGNRYQVVLGESFESVDDDRVDIDGSWEVGHYVRLKYDFVPGRTDLDAAAPLRQRPLGGEKDGKDVQAGKNGEQKRWTAEMEYGTRDAGNSRPVCFKGEIARAQDLECVLVFDGNMFIMDRVSVIGGLKYVQDELSASTGSNARGAGETTAKKRDKAKWESRNKDAGETSKPKDSIEPTKEKKKRIKQDINGAERKKTARKSPKAAEHGDMAIAQPPKTSNCADPEGRASIPVTAANMLSKPMRYKRPRMDGGNGLDKPHSSREGNNSKKTGFLGLPEQGRTARDDHDSGQGNTVGDRMEQHLGGPDSGGRFSHQISRPSTTSRSSEPPARTQ